MFHFIAFDADDTLWHNENIYFATGEKFKALLAPYCEPGVINGRLYQTELANLQHFGYGIKSFTLSMIETAVQLTNGRIPASDILTILNFAKEMRQHPVELLPGVAEVVHELSHHYPLLIITKGDLFDQETKVAQSGIADHFRHVEVVSEKDPATYAALFARLGIDPRTVLMVGNSLRSDVLPLVELGATAVHIPYQTTWEHETVIPATAQQHSYHTLSSIEQLPGLIANLVSNR